MKHADMQQEGVASVFLPRPASPFHAFVRSLVEAPSGESTVRLAITQAVAHGFHWSFCAGWCGALGEEEGGGGYQNSCLAAPVPFLARLTMR